MTILTLAALFGTTVFSTVLTPVQLIVFALVTMIYIPCLSTILALAQEFGWRQAITICLIEIGLAVGIGAVAFRVLSLVL
jgi:ferrous iron transport protein B